MEGATETPAGTGEAVLVTGAGGYIATHIIKQLQEAGYKVRGTLRSLENEERVKRLQEMCPEAEYKLELVEADLTKPDSWEAAVKDIVYVIHVASPNPPQSSPPKDENDCITPAVEGTQSILKACVQAKSVKKVVMTSSTAAVYYTTPEAGKTATEEDWMEVEKLDGHGKSKIMAEKAAWEYVKELPDEDKIELAVVNPGYVLGPVLNGTAFASMEIIKKLLEKGMAMVPKLNFPVIDVRDVAGAHIKAMTTPEASGKRHIVVNDNVWLKEIAQILASEFKPQGYCVPTSNMPNPMLKLVGLFDKSIKLIIPQVGKVYKYDNSRMKDVLGITPRETKETLIDMAYSLIESGLVKRSKKYKGQHPAEEEAVEEGKTEEGDKEEEKKEGETEEEKPKENGDVKEGDKIEDDLKKEGEEKKEEEESDKENKETTEEKKEDVKEEEVKEEVKEEKTEEATEKTEESTEKTEEK